VNRKPSFHPEPPREDHPHCCEEMARAVTFQCDRCDDRFQCSDALVHFEAVFDEYGIIVHDGGQSFVAIRHCPWCGATLPESKRARWFDQLERLGIDDPFGGDVPPEFRTAEWHRGER